MKGLHETYNVRENSLFKDLFLLDHTQIHILFLDGLFIEAFHCEQTSSCLYVLHKKHLPELSLPQLFYDLEVIDGQMIQVVFPLSDVLLRCFHQFFSVFNDAHYLC